MVAGAPLSQISLGSSDDTSTDTRPHSPAGGRAWLGYGSQQLKETRARYIPGCGRSRKPHFNARAKLLTYCSSRESSCCRLIQDGCGAVANDARRWPKAAGVTKTFLPCLVISLPVSNVRDAARGGSAASVRFQRLRSSKCPQGADRAQSGPPTGRVRPRRRSARPCRR